MVQDVPGVRSSTETPPLIGRTGELHRLHDAWRHALARERRIVFLSGEPGIGKTRLAAELARDVGASGALTLRGRCDEDPIVPYAPFVHALQPVAAARSPDVESDSPQLMLPGLVRVLAPGAQSQDALAPPDRATRRLLLFEGVRSALRRLSESRPLLLVLDDLQWADGDTIRLLRYLARGPWDASMLILGSFRDTEGARDHPLRRLIADLHSDGVVERIELHGLDVVQMEAVARRSLGRAITAEEMQWLGEASGGNPFFVQQLVTLMSADGDAGVARGLPVVLREVIERRLSKLSPACGEVLARASVLGATVELPLLLAQWDGDAAKLAAGLDEALSVGLLVEEATPQKPCYRFVHALVQQALYHNVALPLRQQLHLRVARVMAAQGAARTDQPLSGLATHYRRAGSAAPPVEALPYAIAAADAALSTHALDDAVSWWEWALELMMGSGGEPGARASLLERMAGVLDVAREQPRATGYLQRALRLREETGSPTEIATAHSRLGRALANGNLRTTDLVSARRHFEAAAPVLAETSGRRLAALNGGWAELGVSSFRIADLRHAEATCRLSAELGWGVMETTGRIAAGMLAFHLGDISRALELLTEARHEARGRGDVIQSGIAAFVVGIMAQRLCDPRLATRWLSRELDDWPAPGAAAPWGIAPRLVSALADAGDLSTMGALRQVNGVRDEGRIEVMVEGGASAFVTGDWDGPLWVEAEAAARAAVRRGDRCSCQNLGHWLVRAYHARGEPARAIGFIEEELAAAVAGGSIAHQLVARAELAVLTAEFGPTRDAEAHVLRCREILANGADWRGLTAKVLLAEGLLAGARDGPELAAASFEAAVAGFRRHATPWLEARALEDWASVLRRARRRTAASSKRREAEAIYRRIGAGQPWLDRLDSIAATGGRHSHDRRLPDGLTAREVEVLRLIAGGRSNAEIAAELVLSIRTVERHITAVYGKTGASGRAAATAYAIRRRLVSE